MKELKEYIEPERLQILTKIILFNNCYAEYILQDKNYSALINFSKNHLLLTKDNLLVETKNVGIYGFIPGEPMELILEDQTLRPLMLSYLAIKSIMHNEKRIFRKWKLSYENFTCELNETVENSEIIPIEKIRILQNMIK